jgi:hypothetical protein
MIHILALFAFLSATATADRDACHSTGQWENDNIPVNRSGKWTEVIHGTAYLIGTTSIGKLLQLRNRQLYYVDGTPPNPGRGAIDMNAARKMLELFNIQYAKWPVQAGTLYLVRKEPSRLPAGVRTVVCY